MTSGSSIEAMILTFPPHFSHLSISIASIVERQLGVGVDVVDYSLVELWVLGHLDGVQP